MNPIYRANLRITPGAASPALVAALRAVPGVQRLHPLFPSETDPELASLFVVDIEESSVAGSIAALRLEPYVEYVEEPVLSSRVR